MKKFLASFIAAIILLTFNQAAAVEINYASSEIYMQAEMNAAIKIFKKQFGKWKGCKLKNIRYAGDECNNAENLKWLNEIATAQGYAPNFTQCIEFFSDFYVSKKAEKYTVFNPDSEYKNYQWWLARTSGGDWKLLTFGY